jgi:hypothetical protein
MSRATRVRKCIERLAGLREPPVQRSEYRVPWPERDIGIREGSLFASNASARLGL